MSGVDLLFAELIKSWVRPLWLWQCRSISTSFQVIIHGALAPKGRGQRKKNIFFRALPELPKPPPMTPIRATWSSFSEVEIQDLKVSLELKILYILYNILYICNLKTVKVQYIGIFEEIDSLYWPKMYFLKKDQKIRAWVDPSHPFGQCPKENVFFFYWCLPWVSTTYFSICFRPKGCQKGAWGFFLLFSFLRDVHNSVAWFWIIWFIVWGPNVLGFSSGSEANKIVTKSDRHIIDT